jgi:hemolysin activation/secretion protein
VCLADSPGTTQLDSRYQQQEKRRLDLLQSQQEQDATVRLQPETTQVEYSATPEQPCFVIDEIRLKGTQAERFSFSIKHVLNQGPTVIGHCLGVNGIKTLSSRVQNQIIKAGYVTTRVLVEPQDIRSGVLTLTVIPGTVNAVKLSGDLASPTIIASSVPVKEGELLNLRDIEQAVENMRRVPTVAAEVDIVPAQGNDATPGQSDLLIHHSQTKPFRLTFSVDDSAHSTYRWNDPSTWPTEPVSPTDNKL